MSWWWKSKDTTSSSSSSSSSPSLPTLPPPPPASLPVPPPPTTTITPKPVEHEYEELDPMGRFLAYGMRVSRLLGSSSRYLGYTSDLGEAFRPVVSPLVVKSTYAIAVSYMAADVGYNAYRASEENRSVPRAVVHATLFQGLASLFAPFVVIHSAVDVSKRAFKSMNKFQKWGPTTVGLSIIPFLPSYVDEPIEELLEHGFEKYWPEEGHLVKKVDEVLVSAKDAAAVALQEKKTK